LLEEMRKNTLKTNKMTRDERIDMLCRIAMANETDDPRASIMALKTIHDMIGDAETSDAGGGQMALTINLSSVEDKIKTLELKTVNAPDN